MTVKSLEQDKKDFHFYALCEQVIKFHIDKGNILWSY